MRTLFSQYLGSRCRLEGVVGGAPKAGWLCCVSLGTSLYLSGHSTGRAWMTLPPQALL